MIAPPLQWAVMGENVVPLNDIRAHFPGMNCHCHPEADEDMIVVHNAFDRRDDYRDRRRLPS